MTLQREALRALAQSHMAMDPTHDLAHLDRVWENARKIAEGEGVDDFECLCAAAYLHDLVNLPKSHPDRARASRLSAKKARQLLSPLGYTAAQLDSIAHAIEAHSFSAAIPPRTPEARILQDADRLDSLGAIGTARTFAVAGSLQRSLYAPDDPFANNREPDDGQFSLDHWKAKLLQLPEGLQTPTARAIAQSRIAFMFSFLEQLADEIGTPLPEDWR